LGSLIASASGPRQPFFALALLEMALALANWMVWPADPRRGDAQAAPAAAAAAPDKAALALRLAPPVLWATALYGMYTYLGVGLAAAAYSPAQTARAIGLYGIAALVGTLVGGYAADRFARCPQSARA
jgi:predicted MFS family arabinose efflux permease